jgi:hypothetical protein
MGATVGGAMIFTSVHTKLVPQSLVTEYVIRVVPPDIPVTTPEELTVATPVLLLNHVPPPRASLNVVVAPTHMHGISIGGKT